MVFHLLVKQTFSTAWVVSIQNQSQHGSLPVNWKVASFPGLGTRLTGSDPHCGWFGSGAETIAVSKSQFKGQFNHQEPFCSVHGPAA